MEKSTIILASQPASQPALVQIQPREMSPHLTYENIDNLYIVNIMI